MAPSPNSKPEGPPPSSTPLPKKSPSSLDASNLPSMSPPPQGKKSPAPSPEKTPSSPPSPPSDATPSGSPPPSKSSPPPASKSPPPSPPPSQDPSPPNQPTPRVASPPPQGGGTTNPSPPQATNPNPPAWTPPSPTGSTRSPGPSLGATLPTPPGEYTSPPNTPSDGLSPPANNPSGPSESYPRPSSSSLGTPNSKDSDNGAHSKPNQSSYSHGHYVRTTATIVAVGALVVIAFVAVIFYLRWRRKRTNKYSTAYVVPSPYDSSPGSSSLKRNSNGGEYMYSSPESGGGGMGNSKTWFTYEELSKATNGFDTQNILGTGGFGCVYKGYLQDGRQVAVKKLKDNSGQGEREFKAEVEIFTRVHHRHLASLVGCCLSDNQKSLVYEYVPNNTLHHHLHASNKPVMQWPLRVKVACGSARGIAYLHEDCNPRIIHRDIKSANILLDNNFEAKVADFGLAKLAQELESHSHVSTRVMGTFGYMAPEYATSGKLTEKSDVFSFGVVLLELITGRKPVDETRPLGDESLVEWARPLMSSALESHNADQLADPRLEGNYDRSEMLRMIEAAAACVRHSATKRPKMSQLVHEFDTWGEPSDLNNGIKPGQSGIYDSREQSIEIRMFERMRFDSQEYPDSQASWSSRGRTG